MKVPSVQNKADKWSCFSAWTKKVRLFMLHLLPGICPNTYLPEPLTFISSKSSSYFSVSLTDAGPRIECPWNTSGHQDMHYSAS